MKSKFIAAAALSLLASTSAMAGKPASQSAPTASSIATSDAVAAGFFSESFTFSTAANYNGTGSLYAYSLFNNFDQLSIKLVDGINVSALSSSGAPVSGNTTATFLDTNYGWNLAASNTYTVLVTGHSKVNGSTFKIEATHGFIGNTVGPVTPVPEPETYAMLLAGLGLVGTIVRRRKVKQA